ncbi:MAG: family 78 glycoside hydrolase catalytic domain [Verrucomicrobia bacterium]|nr:family 78 glycoside hydrolase catalytic domain [Verrucomicrobiota bacterium]MBT7699779.1 family 78 glycoside hydrolase catalytic domain [Verrucomicrobiota bacterium]
MMIDYATSPLAIGSPTPRFSWEVPLAGRGRKQSAYQILVATTEELVSSGSADLWDSGKVASSQSVNVEYAGAALQSNMDCWWAVQLWDETGHSTGFSAPDRFGTALFDQADWQAQWIGMGASDEPYSDPDAFQLERVTPEVAAFEPDSRAPLLRKAFVLDQPVRRARAFVCGLGLFELRLNGHKVGSDVLATPRTAFRKRAFYSTYDITAQLQQGDNALGLMLGNGWFNGQKKYWGWQMQWHGSPRAIVQLEVELADGSRQRVVSDDTWQGSWSSITFNCLFDGEHVDARLEQPGWDRPGFDDSDWGKANLLPSPGGQLKPVSHEQERVVELIRPVSVEEPEPGVFVFDMGKNITGWVRLAFQGGTAGETVTLRFGEAQHEDGALNAASNNAACQEDRYTLRGGKEFFEPRFTFHGFQFVEVTGYPGRPDLEAVTGCFVRTAVPQTGAFECGNELINRIHRCTLQSQLCNVQMGVPTDDTQRPERQGWGADAWGTAREALYNLWMPRVYQKWIGDFRDQQDETSGLVGMITPQAGANEDLVWTAAFILIPWWQYLHCGDRRILEESYPAQQRYLSFLQRVGVKEISTMTTEALLEQLLSINEGKTRDSSEAERGHLQISQWGDHLATADGSASRSNMPLSIATAFYYQDVSTMADIATVLGHTDDAERYGALATEIKAAFNERFFDASLGYYDTGIQSAQAWALVFGLVPEEHQQQVEGYFTRSVGQTQRRLTTGYIGTKYAIEALSMLGRDDMVWELATATDYPSWGYMLRLNRTTSCERWDGEGGSLNHAPLGAAIDEWFYWGLAGIRPDESAPGFEKIIFKPHLPEDLPWAKATLETARGTIVSSWKHDGATAALTITVPANCSATVHIPTNDPTTITENGIPATESEGVVRLSATENESCFAVGSGTYHFTFSK